MGQVGFLISEVGLGADVAGSDLGAFAFGAHVPLLGPLGDTFAAALSCGPLGETDLGGLAVFTAKA